MKLSRLFAYAFCIIIIFLTGCQSNIPIVRPTRAAAEVQMVTPTVSSVRIPLETPRPPKIVTITQSVTEVAKEIKGLPSITPIPTNTLAITPIPNIPLPGTLAYLKSFPTLNVNSLMTVTRSSPQVCPLVTVEPVKTPVIPKYLGDEGATDEEFLSFLNTYGVTSFVGKNASPGAKKYANPNVVAYQDFTNDGIPEIIFSRRSLDIYGCKDGHYVLLFQAPLDGHGVTPKIEAILDLNHNGIPEIYLRIATYIDAGSGYSGIEWDGKEFKSLLYSYEGFTEIEVSPGYITFNDIDKDGFTEVIIVSLVPVWADYPGGLPWRNVQEVFKWNGNVFMFYREIYDPPIFRFQAVQDGDLAMMLGEFDHALELYQEAIFYDKLEWFSKARRDTMVEQWDDALNRMPTPTLPASDPFEYDNLAAYSYYRIMLVHVARGYYTDAKAVYDTLQRKYLEGKPGHVYVEMASAFWNAYGSSKSLEVACSRTIDYARQHMEDIEQYLDGNGYYGRQSIDYSGHLEYLCPFQP